MSFKEYRQSNFLGADTLSSPLEVSKQRATYMENLIARNGINHKRFGWEEQVNLELWIGEFILGSYSLGNGSFFIGTNQRLLKLNIKTKEIITERLYNHTAFTANISNGLLYMFCGNVVYIYDVVNNEFIVEEGFMYHIPTTRVQLAIGNYAYYEAPNKLTTLRKNLFSGMLYRNYTDGIELELDGLINTSKTAKIKLKKTKTDIVLQSIDEQPENAIELQPNTILELNAYYYQRNIDYVYKNAYVWSNQTEYNNAENKLTINETHQRFLNRLNMEELEEPLGTVAKREVSNDFESYLVNGNVFPSYFQALYLDQITDNLTNNGTYYEPDFDEIQIAQKARAKNPSVFNNWSKNNAYYIMVRSINNQDYYYGILQNTGSNYEYAKYITTDELIPVETRLYYQAINETTLSTNNYILDSAGVFFINENDTQDILGKLILVNGKHYVKIVGENPNQKVDSDLPLNIEAEYYAVHSRDGMRNLINYATISEVINVGEGEILVLSGFPDEHKNTIMFSDTERWNYFPDDDGHHFDLGHTKITNLIRLADGTIAVVKEDNLREPTIYFGYGEARTTEVMNMQVITDVRFKFISGAIGIGGINQKTTANLLGDNLFLTKQGVMSIALVENIKVNERYAKERSRFINPLLTKHNLSNAVATVFNGFYILSVNDKDGTTYVLDSRYKVKADGDLADTFNYESFIWKNIRATSFEVYDNELYFITPNGIICKFLENNYYDISYKSIPKYSAVFKRDEEGKLYGVFSPEIARFTTGDVIVIRSIGEDYHIVLYYTDKNAVSHVMDAFNKELKIIVEDEDTFYITCDGYRADLRVYDYYDNLIELVEVPLDFIFKDVVVSKWYSRITDLGINNMYKTMFQFTITLDPKYSGEVSFGYETRYSSGLRQVNTLGGLDFGNLDFTMFSFVGGFASSYTYRHKHRNFNYIMFMWESNIPKDSAMLDFSVLYKVTAKSRGVR